MLNSLETGKAERWAPIAACLLTIPGWVAILLACIYALQPEWQALRPAALALAIAFGPVWLPATVHEIRKRLRAGKSELLPNHWLGLALTFVPTAFALFQYEKVAAYVLVTVFVIIAPLAVEWILVAKGKLTRKRSPGG